MTFSLVQDGLSEAAGCDCFAVGVRAYIGMNFKYLDQEFDSLTGYRYNVRYQIVHEEVVNFILKKKLKFDHSWKIACYFVNSTFVLRTDFFSSPLPR